MTERIAFALSAHIRAADYYIDLRRITLHHEASKLVGQVMLSLTDDAGIDVGVAAEIDAVAGQPPIVRRDAVADRE